MQLATMRTFSLAFFAIISNFIQLWSPLGIYKGILVQLYSKTRENCVCIIGIFIRLLSDDRVRMLVLFGYGVFDMGSRSFHGFQAHRAAIVIS